MPSASLFLNHRLNLLVIINVTALTYLIVLFSGFSCLDDMGLMHDLQQGHLSVHSIMAAGGGIYYRPLIMLSYYGNYLLAGANPAVFHATNLLLHILNACLLYVVSHFFLKSFQWRRCGALMAALLFALTPLNSEAVVWVSARTDLLCCFFFLLALTAVLVDGLSPFVASALFGLAFLASLCAKEASAPLMLIVPIYLLLMHRYTANGVVRLVSFTAAAWLTGLLYFVLRAGWSVRVDRGIYKLVVKTADHSLWKIIYESLGAVGFYLKKLVWPFPLNLAINSINTPYYVIVAVLLLLFIVLLFWRLQETRLPLLIVVGCLGPPLLAMHGAIPWTLYAERYLYLSMTGAAMLAGLLAAHFWGRLPLVIPFGVVLAFALSANSRAALWGEPLELWRKTAAESPDFPSAGVNCAFELIQAGRLDEAYDNLVKVQDKKSEDEFFWKCRAMIYHQRRDYANYKMAMLKAAEFSANPAELRADMEKNLPRKYRE